MLAIWGLVGFKWGLVGFFTRGSIILNPMKSKQSDSFWTPNGPGEKLRRPWVREADLKFQRSFFARHVAIKLHSLHAKADGFHDGFQASKAHLSHCFSGLPDGGF